ncbi:MAG: IS110 family transposase [Gammaproteobacteria bacterium]|nr:IS110 family transposase [Gammaproteobacteria bacterium]
MEYSNKTVVGVDTAKQVFQLHWMEPDGGLVDLKLSRKKFVEHFANRAPCRIGLEACGGSQEWARRFRRMGHEVMVLPAQSVRAFVIGNKSDVQDARAIWTAVQHPRAKAVAIKDEEQQMILGLHRMRQQQVKFRTATINCLRGLLSEYGEVMPKGRAGLTREIEGALTRLVDRIPEMGQEELSAQWARVRFYDATVERIERKLEAWCESHEACRRLRAVPGVGLLTATALVAAVGDARTFRNGREFAAWLGLVPRHCGTGGKTRILGISKRGDRYLRTLLIHGARALLVNGKDLPDWIEKIKRNKPFNVAVVAVANRQARIVWALLARGREYRKDYVSQPPRG